MLEGRIEDMGDIVVQTRWLLKGRHRRAHLHASAPRRSREAERFIISSVHTHAGRIAHTMDLQADKAFDYSLAFTDEMENPVPTPDGLTVRYSVDAPSILALDDHGDGTATVAATGALGQCVVHVDITGPGVTMTGDDMIMVVPGDAQRVTMQAGPVREVTPD